MPFEVRYASNFYRIEVDLTANLLQATWLRASDKAEIVSGGTALYQVLRDTGIEYAVANAQTLTTLSSEAKEWMSTSFYQLLSTTKLAKLARILPENVFSKIALESVVTRADALGVTKFQVKNFTDYQKALAWLNEK
ncbi:hypothetical protein HUW51_18490 [Adhaeribacter swui]|uniref:STAS/SEC14 domain-containing protein n=1 Tax=Adhaeribacter swui TaxID=2086471 RepID=A0A7G7GBT4_9BACT|nr:hypothetical protein [Adhaeribacter swui]QNF34618.1 hypothetical protein HUW51_18490 [Adhaeribacter swui]